jgi:MFS family permease
MLLSMRVLEGIAAGVIQPLPAIVILSSFPAALQARALGFSGVGVVVVPAIGPWIGGLLIEQMGWRSVFFASAPFGLVALALIRRHLPVGRPGGARPSLDWKGLLLISAAAIALLNALVHARDGHAGALLLVAGGVACGIAFIWVQLRGGPEGLLDMRLFRDRQFGMGALVSFTYGMGLFGSTYLLPVYMQLGLLYPPGLAGLVMLPAGLALGLTIALAGRLAARWAPNVIIAAGLALLSASVASMAAIPSGPALATMIGLVCLGRVGLGAVFPALTLGAMRGLDRSLVSQGAAAINFLRQLGGVTGIGTVGIVLDWRLQVHALPGGLAGGAGSLRAFNETLLVVAALCVVSVVAALRMKPAGKGD